jgi:hypothetical protein
LNPGWYLETGTTPRGFRLAVLNHFPDYGSLRWTVDTPEDLLFVRQVFSHFAGANDFTWLDVLALLEQQPELALINAAVQHKTVYDVDHRHKVNNPTMPPVTRSSPFSAPKPFTDPHIHLIQRNAIQSWQHLGEAVQVLLVGDEPGMAEFSAETGIHQLPHVKHSLGTLVSSIFSWLRELCLTLLAYLNADILLTLSLDLAAGVHPARAVSCRGSAFGP